MHRVARLLLAVGLALACRDPADPPIPPDPPPPDDPPRVATLTVLRDSVLLVTLQDTVSLAYTALDQYGAAISGTPTWSTSDPTVCIVNGDGRVTALANGMAMVRARLDTAQDTVRVTVRQTVRRLTVLPTGARLTVGQELAVQLRGFDRSGHAVPDSLLPPLAWRTENPDIASVAAPATAQAVRAGQTALVATDTSGQSGDAISVLNVAADAAVATVWEPEATLPIDVHGLWGAGTELGAVGTEGRLFRRSLGWAEDHCGVGDVFYGACLGYPAPLNAAAISGTRSDRLVIGGWWFDGTVLRDQPILRRSDGASWSSLGVIGPARVHAVWASGGRHYRAVGEAAGDGRAWGYAEAPQTLPGVPALYGIWGVASDTVFGVGAQGQVLRLEGSTWTTLATGQPAVTLRAVWATGPDWAIVVGDGGTALHWDGATWTARATGVATDLRAVWGTSETNAYAVGLAGTILHWDGNSWNPLSSGTSADLLALWGLGPTEIFAGGTGGVVLRGHP